MSNQVISKPWIDILLDLADISKVKFASPLIHDSLFRDLSSCYDYCNRVTAYHSKSFFMASNLMSGEKRNAIRSLYAFCRTTDDIVDMDIAEKEFQIQRWLSDTSGDNIRCNDPVALAWANTKLKYGIPETYALQLIEGVIMDLEKNRYKDFTELSQYCYHVASSVGLMAMHIIGYQSEEAFSYAIKLGVALQLTNILRDIDEDWNRGRIYLPQDELSAFDIDESYFFDKRVDDKWKEFMRFQIDRARKIYAESCPGINLLHKDGRLAVAAAAAFYKKILDRIEAMDHNVFSERASVSRLGKIRMIPELMIKYKYNLLSKNYIQ